MDKIDIARATEVFFVSMARKVGKKLGINYKNVPVCTIYDYIDEEERREQGMPFMRIFKYPLDVVDQQQISISNLVRVLSVVNQGGELMLYALVIDDKEETAVCRAITVTIIGTGNPIYGKTILTKATFLNSVVVGYYSWHVFYEMGT